MATAQISFMAQSLMRNVTVNAVIPADKIYYPGMPAREEKPFKTLYLLHGIFGNNMDWMNASRIQPWAQARNLAVIMPAGENKFYVDNEASGDMFGEFIGRELVDFTRKLFPLSCKREDTFIAGLSMGGYGAIRNGLKYSDTFGYIAGLSSALIQEQILNSTYDEPTPFRQRGYYESVFGDINKLVGSDKDVKALAQNLVSSGKPRPKIYLACGTEDFLIKENRDFKNFIEKIGLDFIYEEGPGGHTWDFWDTYIKKLLDILPLDDNTDSVHSGNVK